MKKYAIFFLVFLPVSLLFGQKQNKYWVCFKDKANSPYSLARAPEFLSARSLERRAKQGIALNESDLPVNPAYIKQICAIPGVEFHCSSRWLNAAAFKCDSATATQFATLPYVSSVTYVGPHLRYRNLPNQTARPRKPLGYQPEAEDMRSTYGYAAMQNQVLDLQLPHLTGKRGKGIWVAVMDGGFSNVDILHFFDSLDQSGRLFQGHDFVERDASVLEAASHGTAVLSVMAANLPGYFVGTAPDATYFLVKTEDTGGEFPIEEINWVAGAEWADSLGIDVINASLGYTHFNDAALNHYYRMLDGQTAIGSKGAAIAATKGMIICNSAGNEGDGPWKYIGVPADAPGIISVGAVQLNGERAGFSSMGPTADGRIKPDLMAPGESIVVAGNSGIQLGISSGTSLASPMLTGAFATLWSAYPDKSAAEIIAAMEKSSATAATPDSLYGYGLPSVSAAWMDLGQYQLKDKFLVAPKEDGFQVVPLKLHQTPFCAVEVRNILGEKVGETQFIVDCKDLTTVDIKTKIRLPRGAYQAILISNDDAQHIPLMVW